MAVFTKISTISIITSLACSLTLTAAGIWLAFNSYSMCVSQFRWPVFILGILTLFASLAGFVGSYWNKQAMSAMYIFSMTILIGLLFVLVVFVFIRTESDEYEYGLARVSPWLRNQVTGSGNWNGIRPCLAEYKNICLDVDTEQLFGAHISSLQSRCCRPPSICGYSPGVDPDCSIWSNDPTQLCYDCYSCKYGVLKTLRHEWKKVNIILTVASVVLIWVYLIACSAFSKGQVKS